MIETPMYGSLCARYYDSSHVLNNEMWGYV